VAQGGDLLLFSREQGTRAEECLTAWLAHTGVSRSERFELPGIAALNFVLHDALGAGGMAFLRIGPQDKALA
jgi:hypothetical protein